MKMLWVSNLYYLRYILFIWNIDTLCVFSYVTDLLCIEEEKKCYGSKCHSRTSATIERGQPSGSSTFWHCFHLLRIQCTQNTTQFTWSMYTIWIVDTYCPNTFFWGEGLRKVLELFFSPIIHLGFYHWRLQRKRCSWMLQFIFMDIC